MELSIILQLSLMALNLRLPIWKEGGKEFLVMGGMQAVAGCIEEILVGSGLAQMTIEMHSMVLGREGRIVVEDWLSRIQR